MFKRFAALALTVGVTACADLTSEPPVAFRGELAGVGGENITGSVAAVSQASNQTEAGIDVTVPQAGRTVGWQINLGSCANPGERLGSRGAYLDLVSSETGRARLERTFISARMSPDGRYHAVVVDPVNRETVLACGNLERVSF